MKKRKYLFIILAAVLCLVLACFVACGDLDLPQDGVPGVGGDNPDNPGGNNPGNTGNGTRLSSVVESSVTFSRDGASFWVRWDAVNGAQSYAVKYGAVTLTTETPSVNLATAGGFKMPSNGDVITVTITAKGKGYSDSLPTTVTYTHEEVRLVQSPEIISFADGVITWKQDSDVKSYTVKVNGKTEAESSSNTYSVKSLTGIAKIEIIASNGKTTASTSAVYVEETGKLCAMPVEAYTVEGDRLKWDAVPGATGYRVVDLNFNSYVVTTKHYIMDVRNIVYGVYPVMPATAVLSSAETMPVDIQYLEGSGTESDPYVIKTPFDLRTIDYYELRSDEEKSKAQNYYKITGDLDYNTVSALEGESNLYTLKKPFYGVLDGDSHTLSNIVVNHHYGFWALFEFITKTGVVKNIKFSSPEIKNSAPSSYPVDAAIAMLANRNHGTVSGITLDGAKFTATGGGIAGIVLHNYGTVSDCKVNKCSFKQSSTASLGTAAYEMAGVVLENVGGKVTGCNVTTLNISGTSSNVSSAAGVVAINRTGGTVKDNSFNSVTITSQKSGKEAGGVVAYSAKGGTVTKGSGSLGTLTVGGANISAEKGTASPYRGKLYGKQD